MGMTPDIRAGIFAGESGGNYDAIFGYANQDPNSQFYGVRPSQMTVGQVLDFTDPRGAYAQSVKSKIGRVATPIGAYQGVGSTLRSWVKDSGMSLDTPFNQATQDMFGDWVFDNQGTGAWEGYKGPKDPGSMKMSFLPEGTGGGGGGGGRGYAGGGRGGGNSMANSSQWDAIINEAMAGNQQGGGWKGALSEALMSFAQNAPRMARGQSMDFSGGSARQTRKAMNQTMQWLSQTGRKDLAAAVAAGALDPASAVKLAYEKGDAVNGVEVDGKLVNPQTGEVIYQGGAQMDPKAELEAMKAYRGDADVAEFQTIESAYSKMGDAYTQAKSSPTPTGVGDIALLFGYMKLLDPTSVVREGEFATAANAGGVGDKVANMYNKVLNGEMLSQTVRDEIMRNAGNMYGTARTRLDRANKSYTGYNQRAGVPDDYIINPQTFPDFVGKPGPAAAGPPPAAGPGGSIDDWD